MDDVAVIGAGIIGTCIAYTLRKRGARVVLIDDGLPGSGCSYGNLGAISMSSVVPLATAGTLRKLPTILWNSESPLFLPWHYLPRAMPWLLRFASSARSDRVEASARQLASLHRGAVEAHEALAREVGVPELILRKGQLHLYVNHQAYAKDAAAWKLREQFGVIFEQLSRSDILALEPNINSRYQHGVLLPDDATILNPSRYVQAICNAFCMRGGVLCRQRVHAIWPLPQGGWRVNTGASDARYSHVIVAAGAWSDRLLASAGIRASLQSQRGYHAQFDGKAELLSRSVVLTDKKIFLSPMEQGLRAGGTVEIASLDDAPNSRRALAIERAVRQNVSGLEGCAATHWMGHRPCMPNSVPKIGRVSGRPGLWQAIGHGHLGMTDSVNTAGRIADELMAELA
ncbi:FAD-binding oxidoreductase [Allopusillimonas soli]|uniref:FAD-binding oxidoreductase n=1 Tax=Allopusillimonas soli TaxID=659016 RepID=A0A853F6S2_9BURK|nr:FAD-binding oxidoreductase [Allopusillimonas soli]NYT36274.1 FAD-binding oxidoreductase [Allopusillimonas soli]TEA76598.1 FAD-binding oxidoreductase [Allopusillimonas soli]